MDFAYSNNSILTDIRNRLRSQNAQQTNLKLMVGKVEINLGQEDHSHILTTYNVRLLDYEEDKNLIRCRRVVNRATYNGVGEYTPLEDGDMVLVSFREGNLSSGLILGSFFLEGDLETFAIDGKGLEPNTSSEGRLVNQPIVLPDRVATPDAHIQVFGTKRGYGDYRDPGLKYDKQSKLDSYNTPGSITIRDKNGYYANWTSNSQIFYSDRDIILLCKVDGTTKCERLKQEALIYRKMYDLFREAFVEEYEDAIVLLEAEEQLSEEDPDTILDDEAKDIGSALASASGITRDTSLGIATGEALAWSMLGYKTDPDLIANEKEEEYKRNLRTYAYFNGKLNEDHLQYAGVLYHIYELKNLVEMFTEASDNCVESDLLFRTSLDDAIAGTDIRDRSCDLIELEDCSIDLDNFIETLNKDLRISIDSIYLSQESSMDIGKGDSKMDYSYLILLDALTLSSNSGSGVSSNSNIRTECSPPSYGHNRYDEISSSSLVEVRGWPNYKLEVTTERKFYEMRLAAQADGITLTCLSAFRSVDTQTQIFKNDRPSGQSDEDRAKVSAPPGYSQHHTGKALDIGNGDSRYNLNTSFEETLAFDWLQNNASKYGFTLSFPKNHPCVSYEPWHWFQGTTQSMTPSQTAVSSDSSNNMAIRLEDEIRINSFNIKLSDFLSELIIPKEEAISGAKEFLERNSKSINLNSLNKEDLAKLHFKLFNKVVEETKTGTNLVEGLIWPMSLEGNNSCGAGCEFGYERSRLHQGIDIGGYGAGSDKDLVWAAAAGKVIKVGPDAGLNSYGNYVIIKHNDNSETLYAHLESIAVTEGQEISQKEKVGIRGWTGRRNSDDTHLHFEVHPGGNAPNGTAVDPRTVLPKPGLINVETGIDSNNAPQ